MNLVQRAWEENSLADVTRLLTENRASPNRHFEWYYWHRLCYANVRTLSDPPSEKGMRAISFSPDGTRLAMCGDDGLACIWDTATCKRLFTLRGHKRIVYCLAFSPDGKLLATGGDDSSVKLWDTATGRLLRTISNTGEGYYHQIYSVAFSPNGKRLVTGSLDGAAKVWDAPTGKELLNLPIKRPVNHVAFSPDDTQIVTCSEEATQIWNASHGKLQFTLGGNKMLMQSLTAFSKDGARLFVARGDYLHNVYQADVWGAATGAKLFSLPSQAADLLSAALSPDGTVLVTADVNGAITTFDATTGAEIQHVTSPCRCVAFSADGAHIYAAGEKEIKTFATHNLDDIPTIHDDIHISALSPDHRSLATSNRVFRAVHFRTSKAELKVWDIATGRVRLTLKEHVGDIKGLLFSSDGRRIISGGEDGKVKIWDSVTGKCLLTISGENGVTAMDCSPDGKCIATSDYAGNLIFWDAASGKQLSKFQGHHDRVESIAFSPDGKLLATSSYDNTVKVWDAASATASFWDIVAVRLLHTFSHPPTSGWIGRFAVFAPDSRSLLTGGNDRAEVSLWSVQTFDRLLTLHGSQQGITSGSFSPDGKRIVTAEEDGTARLYDSTTGRETLRLKHKQFLNTAVFSKDLTEIVTVSGSDTMQVWRSDYPLP